MIEHADAVDWLRRQEGVDLILCDPPHLDTFHNLAEHGDFVDCWIEAAKKALVRDGVLVHSCGPAVSELNNYLSAYVPHQILVYPHAGEQYATTEAGFTPGHHFYLVWWKRAPGKLRWSGSTVLAHSPVRGEWERMAKPDEPWQPLISALVEQGALVVDPFCGRGEVPLAARATSRRWAGCDINPESVAHCLELGL